METKITFLCWLLAAIIAHGQDTEKAKKELTPPVFLGEQPVNIDKFLHDNIVYPQEAQKMKIQGTTVVQFVIDPNGEICDFKTINSVHQSLVNEVVSVLKLTSGKWTPGTINGSPAAMQKEVSVVFKTEPSLDFVKRAKMYYNKGSEFLYLKNNPAKALKMFDLAMLYLPNDENLLNNRSLCKYLTGDLQGAIHDWTRQKILAEKNGAPVFYPHYLLQVQNELNAEIADKLNDIGD